jgi:glyoxylase I family protein
VSRCVRDHYAVAIGPGCGSLAIMTRETDGVVVPAGFSHVRLTVTDIRRSKNFYRWLLGREPGSDFSDQIDEPGVREDPARTYGGCSFTFAGQTLGLRPVCQPGDRFDPNRVGLDHVSLLVESVEELHAASARLEAAGVIHGLVTELPAFGLAILSVQDPDDINLELAARIPRT